MNFSFSPESSTTREPESPATAIIVPGDSGSNVYYEIQQCSNVKLGLWFDSRHAPFHDNRENELEVWKAYLRYLSLAYPENIYRLVRITTSRRVDPIHV